MNENLTRVNSFFHFLRDILKENPDISFSQDTFYEWITKLDVSGDEYDKNIAEEGWFNEWQKTFLKNNRTNKNIINYFCRFGNREKDVMAINNPLKIYIPIDYKHLKISFEKIINFLNDNNIAYQSKVAKEIRIDNIVVRVSNINDAKAIVEYVNNDEYIKEGLRKPSPFCFNYKGIAFTLDANMSYHSVLVKYIYDYINEKKDNNNLDSIDCTDFYNYVSEIYTNEYEKFTDFSKIKLASFNKNVSYERNILTDKQITKLIISANKDNFGEKDFFEMFSEYNNIQSVTEQKDELCVLRCITAIIKIHGKKYGVDNALNGIKGYISSGNPTYITSDCSLREEVVSNNFIQKLNDFLTKYNTTIEELFLLLANDEIKVLEFVEKSDKEIDIIKNNIDDKLKEIINGLAEIEINKLQEKNPDMKYFDMIEEAIVIAMKRIRIFMATSDPKSITRKKNLRQKIINIRSDLLTILYNTKDNLQNYMNNLIKDLPLLKQALLEEAIYTTYIKYQNLYEEGKIEYDGSEFVCYSLDMLLTKNNYDGFTNYNNMRGHLELITPEDALSMIESRTNKNIDLKNNTDEERINILNDYITSLLNDYTKDMDKDSITLK